MNSAQKLLAKQIEELDAKGAMKTAHEKLQLANLRTKLDVLKQKAK